MTLTAGRTTAIAETPRVAEDGGVSDHRVYDPTLYRGTAPYYARGRPPYSRALPVTLAAELGLDGAGRLLDVGCGPGVLAIELAGRFAEAIGLDPDADMLAEAARPHVAADGT